MTKLCVTATTDFNIGSNGTVENLFFIFFPFCYPLQANSYPRCWVTIEVAVYILESPAEADYSLKAFNTSPMNSSGFQAPGPEGGIHAPR